MAILRTSFAAVAALVLASFLSLQNGVNAGAVELTAANFEQELAGKNALVMFKAAWCGHCKAALPAFNEVADQYNGPDSGVVLAIVECPNEADLCQKHGVSGYPTLKVFDAETGLTNGKAYNGGRDAAAFKSYVDENLKAKCSVKDISGCDEKAKGFIEKMKALAKHELAEQIARLDKMKASAMAPELKKWLFQRLAILKEMATIA